ncbi:hypothetical protein U1Q18_027477 [Sarracenia purpurea var. burkii]
MTSMNSTIVDFDRITMDGEKLLNRKGGASRVWSSGDGLTVLQKHHGSTIEEKSKVDGGDIVVARAN